MQRNKNLSIRKKLLISMLTFSVFLVVLITVIAAYITYNTMKDQLIYNRRMSVRWVQDRLDLELKNYTDRFYEFEVDKDIKTDIKKWCRLNELDYKSKLRLISALNETISMDSNLNSMELYNLSGNLVLLAKRSGASLMPTDDRLSKWKQRDSSLQTNLVFLRNGKEITAAHQIYNFYNHKPIALITMQMRPYEIQDILEDIKMTADESIMIYNDQNELIEADYGNNSVIHADKAVHIMSKLDKSHLQETFEDGNFWFYRSVNGAKLKVLLTVPNRTIVFALSNTILGGLLVAFFAVIISVIGSILFSRVYSKPIIELSAKMTTVMLDDYSDVKSEERADEIGVLQDSFATMLERNQRLIRQEYQSKIDKRDAQLRALQAQINPHFMYNTLQVIGGMSLKKQAPEIYSVTTALSDIMRYTLNFSKEMVILREEIHYLQSYLMIQNERFGNRIDLNLHISRELMDYMIPKLILQPIVENSFEHGLTNKSGKWSIELECLITEQSDLLLIVTDNGIGITPERLKDIREMLGNDAEKALKASSHIGLCNVHSRIKLKYPGDNYGVTIDSTAGQGTKVQVLLKAVKEVVYYDQI
ncbi:sensor histidine kinase [Anaerocolumna sp. MB42-C2]|uniref:sensor histidine kinase n=1 Tax=Anaerocolumna sp. MB42-C2 TaxID=3070997 RepID=UPI0027DF9128|nr:sensor histidine kinase [Anaerocolumna sp. MB42-C2]WMJ88377.1 sensor histidine kinase [Anaerocolumna sp. MB42-C2]